MSNDRLFFRWQTKRLFALQVVCVILIACWYISPTHQAWLYVDRKAFYLCNHLITESYFIQSFWAFCNTRINDWVFDLIMLVFFSTYICSSPKHQRGLRITKVFVAILAMLFIFACINRFIFHYLMDIERLSPACILEGKRLSDTISWISIKERANNSYPGDHATTACSFITVVGFVMGRRYAIPAACCAIPLLILPRLVSGAHWLSDIFLGSVPIVLIPASWIFCSPLIAHFTNTMYTRFSSHKQPNPL